jgi:hypothetical protein
MLWKKDRGGHTDWPSWCLLGMTSVYPQHVAQPMRIYDRSPVKTPSLKQRWLKGKAWYSETSYRVRLDFWTRTLNAFYTFCFLGLDADNVLPNTDTWQGPSNERHQIFISTSVQNVELIMSSHIDHDYHRWGWRRPLKWSNVFTIMKYRVRR